MSIEVNEESGELVVKINGDNYEDLKKAQGKWNFKGVESLIGYAFGILMLHEGKWINVEVNGQPMKFIPKPHLLKDDE